MNNVLGLQTLVVDSDAELMEWSTFSVNCNNEQQLK
ncbi:class III lanthipeptide [Ferrimonas sp. SCSIO 43195]|nr:class III lanthipeptide [Ferrimonas sp. SCSIO 43195]USD36548.1 class III lanthipeptide [Ferrimonas sp. SCSIO 43195]